MQSTGTAQFCIEILFMALLNEKKAPFLNIRWIAFVSKLYPII